MPKAPLPITFSILKSFREIEGEETGAELVDGVVSVLAGTKGFVRSSDCASLVKQQPIIIFVDRLAWQGGEPHF